MFPRPERGYARNVRPTSFFLLTIGLFAIVAAAAAIAGGISWAVPVVLVALVVAVWAFVNRRMERSTLDAHGGDPQATARDAADGGLPKAHLAGDDETALGDSPEVHAEISPHDFPKGAPERRAAEEMAEEESGHGTRGHADPSERDGRLRHPSRTRDG
jgi:hypothetical protein